MSYGIEIKNKNNRILIDENYSNFAIRNSSDTVLSYSDPPGEDFYLLYPGNVSPMNEAVSSDLIIAKTGTNDNGYLAIDNIFGSPIYYTPAQIYLPDGGILQRPDTLSVNILRNMGDVYTPRSSEFGFEVFKSDGNLAFTNVISENFTILESGTFNSAVSEVTSITFPSPTTTYSDFSDIYVVMNSTSVLEFTVPNFTGGVSSYYNIFEGYEYEWTSSNTGRIHVHSLSYYNAGSGVYSTRNLDFNYLILRKIS